jgi:hypothetical protein
MGVMWVVAVVLAQTGSLGTPSLPASDPRSFFVTRVRSPGIEDAGVLPSLPTTVDVRTDLRKRFRLVEMKVTLDGLEIAHRTAARGEELERTFRAYDGAISQGRHTMTVNLVYEGRNAGPFTYLDDYKLRLESTAEFNAKESARPASIEVLVYEKPGATVPIEQKPTMEIKALAGSGLTPAFGAGAALTGK